MITLLEIVILIVLIIALFKNISALVQEKDYIQANQKGKSLFAPLIILPLLYLVAFAFSIIPFIPIDIKFMFSVVAYMPGIMVTRKAKVVFETGCDRSYNISKKIDSIFFIGVAGLIITVVLPLIYWIGLCFLSRNNPVPSD